MLFSLSLELDASNDSPGSRRFSTTFPRLSFLSGDDQEEPLHALLALLFLTWDSRPDLFVPRTNLCGGVDFWL